MAVTRLARSAYYSSSIETFSVEEAANVIGQLSLGSEFPVEPSQRDAWNAEIEILKDSLMGLPGTVFFEYVVPRIGSRIDAVVITGSAVVVIEFKIGASRFTRADENQLWDYALDLKNFHQGSHDASIFPILVATEANDEPPILSEPHHDSVYSPMRATPGSLRKLFEAIYQRAQQGTLNPEIWSKSPYQPTPTIIQAAQALYANHSVDAITRNDAGRENLSHTSQSVEEIVEQTRQTGGRSIVFITGVPGAGKTLVGLNIATKRREIGSPAHAVYLSGNGPLVKVLCEALTRDEVSRLKALGKRKTKVEVGQPIKSFIQNVHHFRDAGLRDAAAPSDHVVIFDEAQRAWNREMTSDFMRRKKGQPDFDSSEPEFLISYLDRHRDWAVIICLVGGGQEINRGEAGISAWFDAVREKFPHWQVYAPSALLGAEYGAASALKSLQGRHNLNLRSGLHLATSIRSFRAERVSDFVHAMLTCDLARSRELFKEVMNKYPIVITRDLDRAKAWIKSNARGSERIGIVASSAAARLKPHAIDIRVAIDPVHWFLNSADDTRSSMYLEDAATEFQVQGLELDWTCVTWDADLRLTRGAWEYHSFVGSRWNRVIMPDRRRYLLNAYRVLLTRARQGMAIFVPPGSKDDPTRSPAFYNETFDYLLHIGVNQI